MSLPAITRARLGRVGVWSAGLRLGEPGAVADAAAELEELGFATLWIPDIGAGLFEAAEHLLGATSTVSVAAGVLNVWRYRADDVSAHAARLGAGYDDRFCLGLGVGHALIVDAQLADTGVRWGAPVTTMERFLDALDASPTGPGPKARILAALGPRMVELAGRRSAGIHSYNVTPAHTDGARAALGPGPLIAAEQAVALESDPERARELGRAHASVYLALPNYVRNLRRLGFSEDDVTPPGSDRLVDAMVASGGEEQIRRRVEEHLQAGADHVCIQVVGGDMVGLPVDAWRRLAPVLVGLPG